MIRPYRLLSLGWLLAALGTALSVAACRDVMPGVPFGELDSATGSESDGGTSDAETDAGGYPDADGFEPVQAAFEKNFVTRGEVGAAVHVTLDAKPLVDLWGGAANAAGSRHQQHQQR